ncbi:phage tail tape measure protein [Tomitella cavernea]|uniref:phage tail tape measure protein n=1 Tax=Tomitella cavernea TaxID=1387982 RepID=UPI0019066640|nr:phage tail tape measure protein [Tomitella cavernea]
MADTVWVPVAPSLKGFASKVIKEASGAARSSGREFTAGFGKAGAAAGDAAADGLAASAAQIDKASKTLGDARAREADLAGKVGIAEAKLKDLRESGSATSLQLTRAEEGLASAQRRAETASTQTARAAKDLKAARDGGEGTVRTVARAEDNLSAAKDRAADAAGKLTVEEMRLDGLRDDASASGEKLARAEAAVRKARAEVESTTEQVTAKEKLHEAAVRDAADAAADSGRESRQGAEGLETYGDKASGAVSQIKDFVGAAAGIGAAVAVGMEAINQAQLTDTLAASLGATPGQAAEYGRLAGDLYSQGLGDSMESVSKAVGVVASSFDNLDGGALQSATQNALNFSKVFEIDVPNAVQTASQLVTNGLAADTTQAFDLMTTAFQRVPAAMREELPEILNEYGTNFRALGFSGEQAFGLLVSAADKGKWALDKTGDALKEFTIRGSDMSKASTTAFESVGLNAEEMAAKIAGGGEGAREALQQTAQALLQMENPADRANAAIALFGTPLEDLSVDQIPQFLQAISDGSGGMEGFAGSAQQMGDTLNGNAGNALESLKRTVQQGLVQALTDMASWMQRNADLLKTVALVAAPLVAAFAAYRLAVTGITIATTAWNTIQMLLNRTMTMNPVGLIVAALAGLVTALVLAYQHSETFRNIVQAAWNGIKTAVSWAWNSVIKPVFTALWGWITGTLMPVVTALWRNVIQPAFAGIGNVISWAWNNIIMPVFNAYKFYITEIIVPAVMFLWNNVIKPAFAGIGNIISFAWNSVIMPVFNFLKSGVQAVGDIAMWLWNNAIKPAWDGISGAIDFAWNNVIKPAFDFIKDGFSGVGDTFSAVGDTISGIWQGIVHAVAVAVKAIGSILQKINIPDWVPGLGGKGLGGLGDSLVSWADAHMADGGLFRGRGGPRDDANLVALSDREFVVNARATAANLPLLQAVNAGWVPPASLLHEMVPGFADGGLVSKQELALFAQGVEGQPYVWGGVHWGDCSGAVSALARYAVGMDPWGGRFATGNEESALASMGFQPGLGPAGSLNIGWYNGGPYGGHTAATLPNGVNFEMGGARGDGQYGGNAVGAAWGQFTDHAHLPPEFFLGGDPKSVPMTDASQMGGLLAPSGGLGTMASGGGGTSSGVSSAGGGSGASAGGGSGGGSGVGAASAAGDAVRVFVTNWPSGGFEDTTPTGPGVPPPDGTAAPAGGAVGGASATAAGDRLATPLEIGAQIGADALAEMGNDVTGRIGLSNMFSSPQLVNEQARVSPGQQTQAGNAPVTVNAEIVVNGVRDAEDAANKTVEALGERLSVVMGRAGR